MPVTAPDREDVGHHGLPVAEVVLLAETDSGAGLSTAQWRQRLAQLGPNVLPARRGPGWVVRLHTDIAESPWYVVEGDDKRRARINMIAHLLSTIDYHEVTAPRITLPDRPSSTGYQRTARALQTEVPDHAAALGRPVRAN